jgi:hypothetical protein
MAGGGSVSGGKSASACLSMVKSLVISGFQGDTGLTRQ